MNILRRACTLLSAALLLSCGGGGGDGSGGGNNPGPPPTVTLTADPDSVYIGHTTTLSWTSSPGTTRCLANGGWTGDLPLSGTATSPQIEVTTTFGVRCFNAGGDTNKTKLVNVIPPEFTLTATPAVVERGRAVTIRWRTKGIDYCQADWGHSPYERPVNGSEKIMPSDIQDEIFVWNFPMRCDAPGVSLSRTATVKVKVLRGQVLMPRRVSIENDVNDPNAPAFPNGDLETAGLQSVFEVRIGYVNQPQAGPQGRSWASGDLSDFGYTDYLDAGDTAIRLILPGVDLNQPVGERADADLYVYDSLGQLIDASVGSGREESVVVPGGDSYYIEVRSVTGATTYQLEIDYRTESTAMHASRVNARFVPDEALVLVEPDGRGAIKAQAGTDLVLQRFGLARKAGDAGREQRVSLPSDSGAAIRTLAPRMAIVSPPGTRMSAEQRRRLSQLLYIKALAGAPGIRAAATNRIVDATAVPGDPLYARQLWNFEMISLPAAWDITTGSSDVTVAVVDTGIVRNHPDLESKLRDGYDMVSDPSNSDHDGLDGDFDDGGFYAGGSYIFHGTHVAGTIGAGTGNGVGVAGVTWGVGIMPLRALDAGSGTMYDILQAVRYAAGLPNDSGLLPSRRADVINMSLGLDDDCQAVEAGVLSEARAAGVLIVASAGNNRSNFPVSPGSCPGVFSVAAVGGTGELAYYSNYGQYVDLAAPGGDFRFDADQDGMPDGVLSTHASRTTDGLRTPDYGWLQGTSMAAPHVAGVLALMKSANPALEPDDVEQLLAAGLLTDDVMAPGRDDAGYGIINSLKAVRAATGDVDHAPRLVASPTVMRFEGNTSGLGLRLTNGGGGLLSVTAIHPSADWIGVTPIEVDANGLGVYQVVVDRSNLPFAGTATGTLAVETTAGTRTVPVLLADGPGYSEARGDFPVYVTLVDANTGEVARKTRIMEGYPFGYRIDDLPPGRYFVAAGTDLNNDGNVCDLGELCGAHPFYGLREFIDYEDTMSEIDVPLVPTAKQAPLP